MILYRHIRLDKNEPFYIGIGTNLSRAHARTGRNDIWNKIVAKTDYKVQIIFNELSRSEACEKEIEFIKMYGKITDDTGCLANITPGGDILFGSDNPAFNKGKVVVINGVEYSSISTASRSIGLHTKTITYRLKSMFEPDYNFVDPSLKVKKYTKEECVIQRRITNVMYGKTHSTEARNKISNNFLGKKHSYYQIFISKVCKINRKEIIVNGIQYMSFAHAMHTLNVGYDLLSRALKKGEAYNGFLVSYAKNNIYDRKVIDLYFEKYKDNLDLYPQPELIAMLKSL